MKKIVVLLVCMVSVLVNANPHYYNSGYYTGMRTAYQMASMGARVAYVHGAPTAYVAPNTTVSWNYGHTYCNPYVTPAPVVAPPPIQNPHHPRVWIPEGYQNYNGRRVYVPAHWR